MSDSQAPGVLESYGEIKKGATTSREVLGLAGLAFNLATGIFRIAFWLAFAAAWWSTLLARTRHGLLALFAFGLPSVFTLACLGAAIGDGGGSYVISMWWAVLVLAWIFHVILAIVRVFQPSVEHVHGLSGGEPGRHLQELWWRIALRLRVRYVIAVLLGESVLLAAIATFAAMADWRWPAENRMASIAAFAIPLMALPGLFAIQLVGATTSAWRISKLKDQESEQIGLSESLAKHPAKPTERAIEGVAEIPE